MFALLKYLKYLPSVLLKFKDVTDAIKSDTGKDRPKGLSRRVIASILLLGTTLAGYYFGIEISMDVIDNLTDHLDTIIVAGVALWGVVMGIVGIVKRKKKGGKK